MPIVVRMRHALQSIWLRLSAFLFDHRLLLLIALLLAVAAQPLEFRLFQSIIQHQF